MNTLIITVAIDTGTGEASMVNTPIPREHLAKAAKTLMSISQQMLEVLSQPEVQDEPVPTASVEAS